jgi:hypothetical protein
MEKAFFDLLREFAEERLNIKFPALESAANE